MGLSTDGVDNFARPAFVMERSFFCPRTYPIDLKRGKRLSQDLSMGLSTIRVDKTVISGPGARGIRNRSQAVAGRAG